MAKNVKKPVSISKADLAKLSKSQQRRYLDLGYVAGGEVSSPAKSKAD